MKNKNNGNRVRATVVLALSANIYCYNSDILLDKVTYIHLVNSSTKKVVIRQKISAVRSSARSLLKYRKSPFFEFFHVYHLFYFITHFIYLQLVKNDIFDKPEHNKEGQ